MESKLLVIHQLRSEGETLEQIGKRYRVSAERIRQLLNQKATRWCTVHKFYYDKICYRCKQQKQEQAVKLLIRWNGLDEEIKLLSKKDRAEDVVAKRRALVRKLHNKHKLSFRRIGRLLKRDHSSIMHLYYKDVNK